MRILSLPSSPTPIILPPPLSLSLHLQDSFDQQIGTAMWVIDILALRVGGEKGEDEADTVGCCSLRREHLTFGPEGTNEIELEFLGKDSMKFKQNVEFSKYGESGLLAFKNIKRLCKGKRPDEQVFSLLLSPLFSLLLSPLFSLLLSPSLLLSFSPFS